MEKSSINSISDINQAIAKNYIHYDPNRIDYSINSFELELVEQCGGSIWKDVFLASIALAVPCLINTIAEYQKLPTDGKVFNLEIYLNSLFGSIGLILGVISLIVWQRNKASFTKLIKAIKDKPRFEMPAQ